MIAGGQSPATGARSDNTFGLSSGGVFTPAPTSWPANLAALAGIVASPATPWTAGQYVRLVDGSKAHWAGAAWAAGPA